MISYQRADVEVPERYSDAHRRFWERLANPGSWLTSDQRIAVVREMRSVWDCQLCMQRKAAVSPSMVQGTHSSVTDLDDAWIEVIHRLTTDPGRLSQSWHDGILEAGITSEQYVEILGTIVAAFSIDEFCRGIGVDLHPLPEPNPGEPDHYRPASAVGGDSWVPMIPVNEATGREADLWGKRTGNVIRAMSLVPNEVRTLLDLSNAHYTPMRDFMVLDTRPYGTLTRMQMELIAGRVSALNECFY